MAIIMDGNRRWAKKRGLPIASGHKEGVKSLKKIVKHAGEIGIQYLTVYAFSTENWLRKRIEISTLFRIQEETLDKEVPELDENNVRLMFIGDVERVPRSLYKKVIESEEKLSKNTGLNLVVALNYGGRAEIVEAAKRSPSLSEKNIEKNLSTSGLPDPDLLIRTGGDMRLSNFLLWQAAYSELYFTDVLWPDFDTRNVSATVKQIKGLEKAGCEIIRVAVPDEKAAKALKKIKAKISIPVVADIHFDHKLALESLKSGADKIRINPGNIGDTQKVKEVVRACKKRNIPIRVGVNIGSLKTDSEKKYGRTAKAMAESALENIRILERLNFKDIVVALKSSDVSRTLGAYRFLSKKVDYPMHLGITEAGTPSTGIIKSTVGLGILLEEGIGDTIRVSLTGDPVEEVRVAWEILKALNLREKGPVLISCPTCGRTEIDLIKLASLVESKIQKIDKPIRVAVMGCVVNGPGEAKEADIGIAGGRKSGVIFKKGKVLKTLPESKLLNEFLKEIRSL